MTTTRPFISYGIFSVQQTKEKTDVVELTNQGQILICEITLTEPSKQVYDEEDIEQELDKQTVGYFGPLR